MDSNQAGYWQKSLEGQMEFVANSQPPILNRCAQRLAHIGEVMQTVSAKALWSAPFYSTHNSPGVAQGSPAHVDDIRRLALAPAHVVEAPTAAKPQS